MRQIQTSELWNQAPGSWAVVEYVDRKLIGENIHRSFTFLHVLWAEFFFFFPFQTLLLNMFVQKTALEYRDGAFLQRKRQIYLLFSKIKTMSPSRAKSSTLTVHYKIFGYPSSNFICLEHSPLHVH